MVNFKIIIVITIALLINMYLQSKVDKWMVNKHRKNLLARFKKNEEIEAIERRIESLKQLMINLSSADAEAAAEVEQALEKLLQTQQQLHEEQSKLEKEGIRQKTNETLPEIEELRIRQERIHELEEEVKRLVAVQVSSHPLVTSLRNKPHYMNNDEWQSLFTLTNELYNNFPPRLQARFPQITPTEMRLCVLLKLRFGHTQIADMQAISPASLSQIKSRLKRKLQQTSPDLFGQEQTLDTFLIDF
mgnify:CR=1 FL=1